jgi:hypothetical protein
LRRLKQFPNPKMGLSASIKVRKFLLSGGLISLLNGRSRAACFAV